MAAPPSPGQAGLALAHRATNHQSKTEMSADLNDLERKLGGAEFKAGLKRGETLMLEKVVDELISEVA